VCPAFEQNAGQPSAPSRSGNPARWVAPDDLPLQAIGKLISAISSEQWIEFYEQSRSKTKAGKTKKAKQGAPSASKVAARRVDTKRRR
jgi:hypothetical protein